MKKIIILLTLTSLLICKAQNPERTTDLYVAFYADIPEVRAETILNSYNLTSEKAIPLSQEKFRDMESEALRISGDDSSIKNLQNIFRITSEELTDNDLELLVKEIELLPEVRYCDFMSRTPVKPPYDIPPVTPNYLPLQTYAGANPGVNMQYAWDMNLTGQGIRLRDIEYGFNKNHEEFHQNPGVMIAPGHTVNSAITTDYSEHGTGTFGVVIADNGNYGVTGLAHGAAEMVLFPEYTVEFGYNRTLAVTYALANSQQGDVVIYEMQTGGATDEADNYVPAEFDYVIWDLTKAASDLGIIVVAAAGNGNQNLDAPEYTEYMNRPNSGAIIVGAGTPDTQHSRTWFSTYGSRVNLQGWGWNVLSSGYGDYATIGDDFNQRYTLFSGTSSATPIVASCVAVLQSYYHSLTGNYLNSAQLIQVLQDTGISQGWSEDYPGNIGPLPNMETAIAYIQFLSTKGFTEKPQFTVYPNPFETEINIIGLNDNYGNVKAELYNALGQRVAQTDFSGQTALPTSHLEKGMYFLKLTQNGKTTTQKVVKR
ncbi:MAG: S8 family peptidase [Flavobacteriaceae bacterium]